MEGVERAGSFGSFWFGSGELKVVIVILGVAEAVLSGTVVFVRVGQ